MDQADQEDQAEADQAGLETDCIVSNPTALCRNSLRCIDTALDTISYFESLRTHRS